jgi:tetratricopeptide (TPR) repeat protein
MLQLNQQDIGYLEGGCSKLLVELKAAPKPDAVAAVDPQIRAAYESADYDRVVTLYGQATSTPGQVPAYETTFQYGQALLKNHQEAMARKVFADLLARVRQQPGQEALLFQLMQVAADMDVSTGYYDEARRQYEELVRVSIERGAHKEEWAGLQLAGLQPGGAKPDELKEYGILLKNYLAYTPKRDGYAVAEQAEKFLLTYPASRLVPSANVIGKTTREQADAWLNQGIKRIEALASERKSQEPSTTVGPATLPPPTSPGGQEVVKSVEPATPTPPPAPVFDEKALQDDYDKGMKHLQAKEYDKAIEGFTKLLNTPFEGKARAQINEAAKLGASEDRQKAADLFSRALSSRDKESKKKLLLSSRQLLQGILVKYPQSGLTDKVQKNLSRTEEELKAIDSSLLTTPPSKGGAYVPPPGA